MAGAARPDYWSGLGCRRCGVWCGAPDRGPQPYPGATAKPHSCCRTWVTWCPTSSGSVGGGGCSGVVDEPARDRDVVGAGGAGDREFVVGADRAEGGGPADQVVGRARRIAATHCSPAELTCKLPDGMCSSPTACLMSRMASSTTTW